MIDLHLSSSFRHSKGGHLRGARRPGRPLS